VLVCNRIKTHTQFFGDIESGLLKMLLIGLGKLAGAKVYHRAIKDNRCCLHRGRPWDRATYKRILHRTTLAGDGPAAE